MEAWFDGLTLNAGDSDGTTVIHGSVIDQAALHGLLQKVRDIGVAARSEPTRCSTPTAPPSHPFDPSLDQPHHPSLDPTTGGTVMTRISQLTPLAQKALGRRHLLCGHVHLDPDARHVQPGSRTTPVISPRTGRPDTLWLFGCLLEVIVALAGIGTAVTLYPVAQAAERERRARLRDTPWFLKLP